VTTSKSRSWTSNWPSFALRQQRKHWAERKADDLEQVMVTVSNVRREKQMAGVGGSRIHE
jgi:hypothetical protein